MLELPSGARRELADYLTGRDADSERLLVDAGHTRQYGDKRYSTGELRLPATERAAAEAAFEADLRRAAEMLGQSWREVWDGFAARPAGLMGLSCEFAVGQRADFCVVKENIAGGLESVEVVS